MKIDRIDVEFAATINGGQTGRALELFYDWKARFKTEVESNLRSKLSDASVTGSVATALAKLIDTEAAKHIDTFATITIDPSGLHAIPGVVCVPLECGAQGATCGAMTDRCGGRIFCPCGPCAGNPCGADARCIPGPADSHTCKAIDRCESAPGRCGKDGPRGGSGVSGRSVIGRHAP